MSLANNAREMLEQLPPRPCGTSSSAPTAAATTAGNRSARAGCRYSPAPPCVSRASSARNGDKSSRRRSPNRTTTMAPPCRCRRSWAGWQLTSLPRSSRLPQLEPLAPVRLMGGLLTLRLIRYPVLPSARVSALRTCSRSQVIAVLCFVIIKLVPRIGHPAWAVAIGLLCAGVAGNLTDRLFRPPGVLRGHVIGLSRVAILADLQRPRHVHHSSRHHDHVPVRGEGNCHQWRAPRPVGAQFRGRW